MRLRALRSSRGSRLRPMACPQNGHLACEDVRGIRGPLIGSRAVEKRVTRHGRTATPQRTSSGWLTGQHRRDVPPSRRDVDASDAPTPRCETCRDRVQPAWRNRCGADFFPTVWVWPELATVFVHANGDQQAETSPALFECLAPDAAAERESQRHLEPVGPGWPAYGGAVLLGRGPLDIGGAVLLEREGARFVPGLSHAARR